MSREEVKSYKWRDLKDKAPPNSVLYVLEGSKDEVGAYVTNKWGKPIPLSKIRPSDIDTLISKELKNIVIFKDGKIDSKEITSDAIEVVYSGDKVFLKTEGRLLKPGDKVSQLENDAKYITEGQLDIILADAIPKKTSDLINDGENGVDKFITASQVETKVFPFNNTDLVVCNHGYGRYVDAEVIIGVQKVLADIEYMTDLNTIVVKMTSLETGIVIVK